MIIIIIIIIILILIIIILIIIVIVSYSGIFCQFDICFTVKTALKHLQEDPGWSHSDGVNELGEMCVWTICIKGS